MSDIVYQSADARRVVHVPPLFDGESEHVLFISEGQEVTVSVNLDPRTGKPLSRAITVEGEPASEWNKRVVTL